MINITKKGDTIIFKGHTVPEICAAVSSIMYTSVNMLLKYNDESFSFKDDDIYDRVIIQILKHDSVIDMIVDNMFEMLNDLYEDGNGGKIRILRS